MGRTGCVCEAPVTTGMGCSTNLCEDPSLVIAGVIPTRADHHALAQFRSPKLGRVVVRTKCNPWPHGEPPFASRESDSLRSENPWMSHPSRGLVLVASTNAISSACYGYA